MESKQLEVKDGIFYTILGDSNPFDTLVFDRPYWLSIQLGNESEITARIPFSAVPYSISAIKSDTARFALTAPAQAYADSTRIAGTVPDNAISSEKIIDGTIRRLDVAGNFKAPSADTADYVRNFPPIDSTQITDGSVTTADLRDQSVTAAKIDTAGLRVTSVILENSIDSTQIKDGSITAADLRESSIDSTKLAANSVTNTKLVTNVVTGNKIQDSTITQSKLTFVPGTVRSITAGSGLTGGTITTLGTIFISNGGVTNTMLADNAVTTAKIRDSAVTMAKINPSGATLGQVVKWTGTAWTPGPDSAGGPPTGPAGGVLSGMYPNPSLANDSVTTTKILDGAVTIPKISGILPLIKGGTGTSTSFGEGSIVFADSGGVYSQSNANLFWDNTNKRLGIGTVNPVRSLDVSDNVNGIMGVRIENTNSSGAGAQQRLEFGGSTSLTLFNPSFPGSANILRITNNVTGGSIDMVTAGAIRFTVANTGNVGIATASPGYKLDVNGIINATDIYKNGLPFSGASQWTTSGSDIYYNSGNVGIGTTSPGSKLDISDGSNTTYTLRVTKSGAAGGNAITGLHNGGTGAGVEGRANASAGTKYGVAGFAENGGTNYGLYGFASGGSTNWGLYLAAGNAYLGSGNVGIGTAIPAAKLDIVGNLRIADGTQGVGKVLTSDSSGVASWQPAAGGVSGTGASGQVSFWTGTSSLSGSSNFFWNSVTNRLGIGTTAPLGRLHINNDVSGSDSSFIVTDAGRVGIGTTNPGARLQVVSSDSLGIRATSSGTSAIYGYTTAGGTGPVGVKGQYGTGGNSGYLGQRFYGAIGFAEDSTSVGVQGANLISGNYAYLGTNTNAVFGSGNLTITGSKSFRIDHPLDPENKYLLHYCAEGPEPINAYSGNVTTDAQGIAWITLPDWFEEINRDFRYTLTVVDDGDVNDFVQAKVIRKIRGNRFAIKTSRPRVEVSWEVKGVRNDLWVRAYGAPVEALKLGSERGTYQHPELYGKPKEMGPGLRGTPARAGEEEWRGRK
ncbi:MAG: hypothetical protein HY707_11495 [Ignavibacteriae bacterium]|nr:hypothetical protein [Ignavibacteriota bacterium]